MTGLAILSPLAGWAGPLDEVDDEVFAARMLGDGLAIDPTDETPVRALRRRNHGPAGIGACSDDPIALMARSCSCMSASTQWR